MSIPSHVMENIIRLKKQRENDADMLSAITQRGADSLLDFALKEGANPNAIGVTWDDEAQPSKVSPLIKAIEHGNEYAVQKLLEAGANVFALSGNKTSAICVAVFDGNEKIVNMLLLQEPKLIDVTDEGWSLLHIAVFQLTAYSIIHHGKYESEEIRKVLIRNYERDSKAPQPPDNLTINYKGHKNIISTLLSRAPKMMHALGQNGVTPLDIIKNPMNFKHLFGDCNSFETIRCLTLASDSSEHVLTFHVTLCDKFGGYSYPATVHFDFRDLQLLFKKVERSLTGDHQLGSQLSEMQVKLSRLMQPKQQRAEWKTWIELPGHENLAVFYHRLLAKFQNTITSFKAVDGGQINPKEKMTALTTVLGGLASVADIVPVIGAACAQVAKGMKMAVQKVDESRQLNAAEQVGQILSRDVEKDGPILARMLTLAFAQQLLELPTSAEAEATAKRNPITKGLNRLNALVLKGQFTSPAEIEAMVAMTLIVEFLYETPDIGKQVQQKGLANVFFAAIVAGKPSTKINKIWRSVTEQLGGLTTKAGESWSPEGMYLYTGIRTAEGNCCVHPLSKPAKYGWCLVTLPVLRELIAEVEPVEMLAKRPPEYLLKLKMPQSSSHAEVRSLSPSTDDTDEDTRDDNSLSLPMPETSRGMLHLASNNRKPPEQKENEEDRATVTTPRARALLKGVRKG